MPSYHDVVVICDGKRYVICEDYSLELSCNRIAGWCLWFKRPMAIDENTFIGGEFDSDEFRIEISGIAIVDKRPDAGGEGE